MLAQAHFLRTKAEPRLVSFFTRQGYVYLLTLCLVLQALGAITR